MRPIIDRITDACENHYLPLRSVISNENLVTNVNPGGYHLKLPLNLESFFLLCVLQHLNNQKRIQNLSQERVQTSKVGR